MNYQGFYIGNIGKQRENRKVINKLLGGLGIALYLKGEDRTGAIRKVFFVQGMARIVRQRGMVYGLNLRMVV